MSNGVDVDFVKYMLTMGVGGVIAALIFSFYRKDVKQFTDLWKSQTEMLMRVVQENTSSNTRLTIVIESLHRRLDMNGLKRSHEDH